MPLPINNRRNPRKRFLYFPMIACVLALVLGEAVMLLWNAILPNLLHVNTIGYWQAVGLLVMCRILFGNFGRGGGPQRGNRGPGFMKDEKWMQMTQEDRAKFKDEWRERCRKREEK